MGFTWQLSGSIATARRVDHAHRVLLGIEHVFSLLKDAETGQRGYLLTGRSYYLEPYQNAVDELTLEFARIEQLVRSTSSPGRGVGPLQAIAAEKLAELQESIDTRREQGLDAALRMVLTDRGRSVMRRIRRSRRGFEPSKEPRLEQESIQADTSARLARLSLVIGLLVGLSLLLASHRLVAVEMKHRRKTESGPGPGAPGGRGRSPGQERVLDQYEP